MIGNPPELAVTIEEHESAAIYHEEAERVMRSAGRMAVAEAHQNAAMLHRQAVRLGSDALWAAHGGCRIDPADDSPQQYVPSYGEFARMGSKKAKEIETSPETERALEKFRQKQIELSKKQH
jgi:hypothetical protein